MSRKNRSTKICPVCGKEFGSDLKACQLKSRIFCGRECYFQHKHDTHKTKICLGCGKEFGADLPPEVFRNRLYCCRDCSGHNRPPKRKILKDSLICKSCGKPFGEYFPPVMRTRQFCSKQCKINYQRGGTPDHPYRVLRKGNNQKVTYRGANWRQQRKQAFLRDGGKCQICGCKSRPNLQMEVHHIRAYREFGGDYKTANLLSNLITLCKRCHNRVENSDLACPRPLFNDDP